MSKLCLMVNKLNELNLELENYIIGLKNFNSLNILEINLEELKEILEKYENKNIFLSLNKLIHNDELDKISNILIELSKLNISGIIFDDISIFQLNNRLKLNLNLIWGNIHATTNYITINEWNKLGVKSAIVSPDITLNEIIEIKNNTDSKIFMINYGMYDIFSSNRNLLSNYLNYINKDKKNKTYYIKNKDTLYPIYENDNGSHIVNGNILNAIDSINICVKNSIDYLVINSYMIDNIELVVNTFKEALDLASQDNLSDEKLQILSNKLNNSYRGFLDKETIYKVKSDVNE